MLCGNAKRGKSIDFTQSQVEVADSSGGSIFIAAHFYSAASPPQSQRRTRILKTCWPTAQSLMACGQLPPVLPRCFTTASESIEQLYHWMFLAFNDVFIPSGISRPFLSLSLSLSSATVSFPGSGHLNWGEAITFSLFFFFLWMHTHKINSTLAPSRIGTPDVLHSRISHSIIKLSWFLEGFCTHTHTHKRRPCVTPVSVPSMTSYPFALTISWWMHSTAIKLASLTVHLSLASI